MRQTSGGLISTRRTRTLLAEHFDVSDRAAFTEEPTCARRVDERRGQS